MDVDVACCVHVVWTCVGNKWRDVTPPAQHRAPARPALSQSDAAVLAECRVCLCRPTLCRVCFVLLSADFSGLPIVVAADCLRLFLLWWVSLYCPNITYKYSVCGSVSWCQLIVDKYIALWALRAGLITVLIYPTNSVLTITITVSISCGIEASCYCLLCTKHNTDNSLEKINVYLNLLFYELGLMWSLIQLL